MKMAYKVITALLAAAIIVMFIFTPLISIRVESLALSVIALIGQYTGNETINDLAAEKGGVPSAVSESISVHDVFFGDVNSIARSVSAFAEEGDSAAFLERIEVIIAPALAFIVLGILAIICAIVTIVLAFAAKDNRKVIYSALAGLGISYMMPATFKAVAEPFLNDEITIGTLMDNFLGSLLGSVTGFQVANTFWFIPVTFALIILWTVLYNYTLPEKEKRERKLMLGEADE